MQINLHKTKLNMRENLQRLRETAACVLSLGVLHTHRYTHAQTSHPDRVSTVNTLACIKSASDTEKAEMKWGSKQDRRGPATRASC